MIIKHGKMLKVGFTCSAFDLCHAGHISMLEEAKSQCDWLIVGLHTDPTLDRPTKNRPVQSIVERFIQLNAVKYVDQIIPYNTEKDLEDLLLMLPIDVRILGDEYRCKEFTGKSICVREIFNCISTHENIVSPRQICVEEWPMQKIINPNRQIQNNKHIYILIYVFFSQILFHIGWFFKILSHICFFFKILSHNDSIVDRFWSQNTHSPIITMDTYQTTD